MVENIRAEAGEIRERLMARRSCELFLQLVIPLEGGVVSVDLAGRFLLDFLEPLLDLVLEILGVLAPSSAGFP